MILYSLVTFDDLGVTSLRAMSETQKTDFIDNILQSPPAVFNRMYHADGTTSGWIINHQGTSYQLQFTTTPVLGYTSGSQGVAFQAPS